MATIASLTRTGVPKPRPQVEEAMSTIQGGHITRRINFTQNLAELKLVMQEYQDTLTPLHMAAAARQLEKLYRHERASPLALNLKTLATQIEEYAAARAARLSSGQVSSIVRGLTGSSHTLHTNSLLALAAVLVAKDCQRLKLASDQEWKDIVWGFSMQGFENSLFWSKVAAEAAGHVQKWEANRAASVLKNMANAGCVHAPFMDAAFKHLSANAAQLTPLSIADALYAAVQVQRAGTSSSSNASRVDAAAIQALQEAGAGKLGEMDGKCLALFISSLGQLGAGSKELASKASAAARALPEHGIWPLYIQKLVAGCTAMQLEDAALYEDLANRAAKLLHKTADGVQVLLVQALQAAPGAAKLPAVVALEAEVRRKGLLGKSSAA